MDAIKIAKNAFSIVGILLLTGTFFMYESTNEFLKTSITAEGKVIDLLQSRSSSSSDNSITYKPLVRFIEKKGTKIEFTSSTSSNPPSYHVGEKVEVLYNPESPNNAKIKGFFSIWGGVTIVGTIGLVFFIVGASIFIFHKNESSFLRH